ncbi:MAG: SUMF1/EgtB/PvdO family nonheme iron enzyme [Candidatus Omnitrophica bacterium]|nr:SUMF1/EgtB/PvdO family nonheme iron enzyme [Candidatus Omnitrophota bacterium]
MGIKILRSVYIFFLVGVALSFLPTDALANHLQINNFALTTSNVGNNTMTFSADFMWENSWKSVDSNDAVWVFLKYSTDGGTTWKHASMAGSGINPAGFDPKLGFQISVPSDEKGFFLELANFSNGNIDVKSVKFVWDYGQDGLTDDEAVAANTVTKIYGVEMVKIPQGAFYAGDGNSSSDYRFTQGSGDNEPWYIANETAINVTNAVVDGFYYQSSGASGESATGANFLIPTSFPKGFNSFYLMKYELTEGQWVSFFNTLSYEQKVTRDITSGVAGGKNSDSVVNRNTISWNAADERAVAQTSRPDRPMSFMSWPDLLAYADWAGLRPVTELEYEKAARGVDILPLVNEYAWGKDTYNDALSNEIYPDTDEDGREQIFDGGANINRNTLSWSSGDGRAGGQAAGQVGPLRAGIFAESSTNRTTSGAGYYGNMELSGNLNEMVVSVGRNQGRQYLGSHGDGQLTQLAGFEGNANNTDWPGIDTTDAARGVTSTVGSGCRGGDFQSAVRAFQISTRIDASRDPDSLGYQQRYDPSLGIFQGGRLARTAP